MGYYSHLWFKCTNDVFPDLYKVIKKVGLKNCIVNPKQNKKYTMFEFVNIKWYSDYPEVQAIDAFVDTCNQEDPKICYIRQGENFDDIETAGCDSYELDCDYYVDLIVKGFDEGKEGFPILQQTYPELFI